MEFKNNSRILGAAVRSRRGHCEPVQDGAKEGEIHSA
jgi:hypothetical protein